MRPRPKSVKQIINEKWSSKRTHQPVSPEYNSEIATELALCLPDSLKKIILFEKYDNNTLTLSMPNASYQMQFNAHRSLILTTLRKKTPALISIKCIVSPSRQMPKTYVSQPSMLNVNTKETPPTGYLSPNAAKYLTDILPDLPEELQKALNKLIR